MWLGIDDTDSPAGGCTTFTLLSVLEAAQAAGFDPIGDPRLVRLDPNVPMKTRGNAALAARFGRGRGRRRRIGSTPTGPIWSFPRGDPLPATDRERLVDVAWTTVLRTARVGDPGTDPVLVAMPRRPAGSLYREAVSRLVDTVPVVREVERLGGTIRHTGPLGGAVGAAAALAWPGRRATWELIAYRRPSAWGRPRRVSARAVRSAERRFPELFACFDPDTRRLLVAPHTPCPILFGLRATRPGRLPKIAARVGSEPVDRWVVFRTNQGTGDHLVPRAIRELRPFDAARLRGRIDGTPIRLPGGHVRFPLRGPDGATIDCLAFEPTKTLPRIVSTLVRGDRVELWGGRGADAAFRLEGVRLLALAPSSGPPRPPRCPGCGSRTRSLGRGRGFRCAACRRRLPLEAGLPTPRARPPSGTHQPTLSARRHLAPVARGPAPTHLPLPRAPGRGN